MPTAMNDVSDVQHAISIALLSAIFASYLVPMLIAILFFSVKRREQRTHIFWLNVAALGVGICEGFYLVAIQVKAALYPSVPVVYPLIALALCFYTPVFVEVILIFRLLAVYSVETTPPLLRRSVIGIPILFKIARFSVITALLATWTMKHRSDGIPIESELMGFYHNPYPRIAWALQLADTTFCSAAFIFRLRHRIAVSRRYAAGTYRKNALDRLQTISVIALCNYVIPSVICLAHFILVSLDWDVKHGMRVCSYLMISVNYTTIIGVVFATLWASSREWRNSASFQKQSTSLGSSISMPISPITPAIASGARDLRIIMAEHPLEEKTDDQCELELAESTAHLTGRAV